MHFFRPVEFFVFIIKRNLSTDTINDHRLPPSCMTSMEKLTTIYQMIWDKQCASREAKISVNVSLSNHEVYLKEILFDSYSDGDIKELEDQFNENPSPIESKYH